MYPDNRARKCINLKKQRSSFTMHVRGNKVVRKHHKSREEFGGLPCFEGSS